MYMPNAICIPPVRIGGNANFSFRIGDNQVRANVYILERPPVGVHSVSMVHTNYLDRPERSG